MSEQIVPPQQPFQGQTPYNQSPLPHQQQSQAQRAWNQTGYPQQSGMKHGYPQQSYPQQEQWGQPQASQYRNPQQSGTQHGFPQQEQWEQPPTAQYGFPQQPQYAGQVAQNNAHTPPPQFQYGASKTSKSDFLKKKVSVPVWGIIIAIVLFISIFATSIYALGSKPGSPNPSVSTSSTSSNNPVGQTTSVPTSIPTSAPTVTPSPTPTLPPSQTEAQYKASAINTTVTNLDKDGTTDQGKNVHFTCIIGNFVKDSSGTTAGANVRASNSDYIDIIQIGFPSGTDITRLNEGDTIEVWGTDGGVFSGTNAFGGTVQEVGISVMYMTDQTTNYQE